MIKPMQMMTDPPRESPLGEPENRVGYNTVNFESMDIFQLASTGSITVVVSFLMVNLWTGLDAFSWWRTKFEISHDSWTQFNKDEVAIVTRFKTICLSEFWF